MRTIAQETVSQIALRNCSEDVGGKLSVICDFSAGDTCSHAHILAETCCQSHEGYY